MNTRSTIYVNKSTSTTANSTNSMSALCIVYLLSFDYILTFAIRVSTEQIGSRISTWSTRTTTGSRQDRLQAERRPLSRMNSKESAFVRAADPIKTHFALSGPLSRHTTTIHTENKKAVLSQR